MPTLPKPALMLVTDRHSVPEGATLAQVVAEALAGGVNMVQLREKDLPAGALFELGQELKRAIAGRALFIVNDRVDVAVALEADGVQLPETGLSVAAARAVLGANKLIGRSVHSPEGALDAERAGADYLIFGSLYVTGSHPGAPVLGLDVLSYLITGIPLVSAEPAELEELREGVLKTATVPVLPIGGITAANAGEVMSTGVAGVAVMSAIVKARDPRWAAQELWAAI